MSPQLLKLLIDCVSDEQLGDGLNVTSADTASGVHTRGPLWQGIFYAILLFLVANILLLLREHFFHRLFIVGMRVRAALIGVIYKKTLCLSNTARKESTVGEIVNLMAVGELS